MIFALDTSTAQIGLALYDGAQVVAESLWSSRARHTAELAPAFAEMLAHTGVKVDEIKAVGVAIGPGSFTSLRVGLAFGKGLALSRNLPIIGIPTLDVVAASQPVNGLPLGCLLPAGRGRLALGWYRAAGLWVGHPAESGRGQIQNNGWQAQGSPVVTTAQDLVASIEQFSIICGDLTPAERQILGQNPKIRLIPPVLSLRRPALLAELAFARWQAGQTDPLASLAPIYLHIGEPILA